MSVRARMYVSSVERFTYGDQLNVKLTAVTRNDTPDNISWSKYTPSGSMALTITNPDAFPFFLERLHDGADVYVDITPADPPAGD